MQVAVNYIVFNQDGRQVDSSIEKGKVYDIRCAASLLRPCRTSMNSDSVELEKSRRSMRACACDACHVCRES